MDIRERIKGIREDLNLTQTEMGERLGVQKSAISKMEKGENGVTEQTIKLICREFSINPDWLKNGVEPMKMPANEADMGKMERIMYGDNEFVKSVFRGLADLPVEAWKDIEAWLDKYIKEDRP